MMAKMLWCVLPLTFFASQSFADNPSLGYANTQNPELYFFSCYKVGEVEFLSRDLIASAYDGTAALLHAEDIEPILEGLAAQSQNGVGIILREIGSELSKVQDREYISQLNILTNQVRTSPENYFGSLQVNDDLKLFWFSNFVNVWYSPYEIETEECAVRRYDKSTQLQWDISEDWARLKVIADNKVTSSSRGVLGDIVEVSGTVSNVIGCEQDQIFRLSECMEITLVSELSDVKLTLSALDLEALPKLQIGAMIESAECLITKNVAIDTYNLGDAVSSLSAETVISGALVLGGGLLGVDTGLSGQALLGGRVIGEVAEGLEAHAERLQISCSTTSLNPVSFDNEDRLQPDAEILSGNSVNTSEVTQTMNTSKAISDVLLLVEQGSLERTSAFIVIERMVSELDVRSRTEILIPFVAENKLSGDELVQLLE